ncbi:MAG: HipA domain-containing protein [Acidobacteriota bacterium]
MNNRRCLYCYQKLEKGETDFHPSCSKKIFSASVPPELPYTEAEMDQLALKIIRSQITITGVQPKLSLEVTGEKGKKEPGRFTIVGLWGSYILKPPTAKYPQMPELEDVTMHLAQIAKIETVPHSLIRLKSGTAAYITKRIDRLEHRKLHMEDMCQLTERLTEQKYHGSYEQIAKAIMNFSSTPGLDVVNFFEQVLFSFITGNADMHLKNFSLIEAPGIGTKLAPAYDLLATALINPADTEELALTLNGKKRKIGRNDFIAAMTRSGLDPMQQRNILGKFEKVIPQWLEFIDISFLSEEYKAAYKELLQNNHRRIQ